MRTRPVATLALVLASALAAGEELTPVRAFRAFTRATAPDLPESIVLDLVQDASGLLWIDTIGGLATYDGAALRAVRDPEAPRGGSLLASRQAGGVYAVSRRGLHVFDGRWRRIATSGPIGTVAEEDGRFLWAVLGDDIARTPVGAVGTSWERVTVPVDAGPPRSLASDRNGGVFVFGRDRIVRCRGGECVPVPASGARPDRATTALVTRAGGLWVGTWDGRLLHAAPGAADWTPVDLGAWPSGGVRSLAEDRDGRVWVGGMARLCHGTAAGPWACWGAENGLPASAILSLLADREGTLWLGLNGGGLLQWVGQPWTHRTRWPGDAASGPLDVIALAPTRDGGVLASVFGRGILRWDGGALTTWGRAEGLVEDVRAVVEPSPGAIWAGARRGVFEQDGAGRFRRTLALANGFASGFARGPDGTWHVFTEAHGVFRRVGERWEHAAELDSLVPGANVRAMEWSEGGGLWIATYRELVHRSRTNEVTRHPLGLERGLPDSVTALLAVGPDEVWAGGQGGLAIRRSGRWTLLGEADGVPGNVYFLRAAPDGVVWVGGSRGIARVRDGRWTRWDRTNGLVGDECNGGAVVLPDGTLLAATAGSLARFDPSVAPPPAAPLRVHWIAPDDAQVAPLVRRPADERRLVVGWSAPWLAPQPVEYATRVGGGSWSAPTRTTELAVENLPAGRSQVAVRARRVGPDEEWSQPAALYVEVAPHAWETLAARFGLGLAVVGLALAAAHLVMRRLHARRARALERMRTDFMASASHELRTPIAQIRLFADMLRLGRARTDVERSEALATIHRATLRLESLAGNLMRLARGETRPLASLPRRVDVAALAWEAARDLAPLAAARGATIDVDVAPTLFATVEPDGLRMVLTNLVENALKYGPPGQVVRVGVESAPEGLRLAVEDEGPGIPAADRDRVWERFERLDRDRNSAVGGTGLGLAVVRETVAQAGGEARIEDGTPTGTRVVVVLPQPEADDGRPVDDGRAAAR